MLDVNPKEIPDKLDWIEKIASGAGLPSTYDSSKLYANAGEWDGPNNWGGIFSKNVPDWDSFAWYSRRFWEFYC